MPDPADAPPLSAGATVIRLATAIGVRATEIRDAAGLTHAELRVLRRSLDAPRMGDLAEQLEAPKSTITSVVDQLVARGLVSRTADAQDRRRQLVTATRQGVEALARFDAALASRTADLVVALTVPQRARLGELLARLPGDTDSPSGAAAT